MKSPSEASLAIARNIWRIESDLQTEIALALDNMNCPHCKKNISDKAIARHLASKAGKKGKGAAKARTSEQARAAANARWGKGKL